MSQIMLLTKRLTTFLSQNTTLQLPTLLLLSPNGKLLSSSSPLPASILRSQATLACSLWTLYQPNVSSLVPASLPPGSQQNAQENIQASETAISSSTTAAEAELSTITIQLSHGIMVIRALSCGLLFVAMGPSGAAVSSPNPSPRNLQPQQAHQQTLPSQTSPPLSPLPQGESSTHEGAREREITGSGLLGIGSGSPSEAGSVRSMATKAASIMGIRRQAVEIGRFLDTQLEGFVMSPGEGR